MASELTFRASLGESGQNSLAPPKMCLLLYLWGTLLSFITPKFGGLLEPSSGYEFCSFDNPSLESNARKYWWRISV